MALFEKNSKNKRKVATPRIYRDINTQRGIENLQKTPSKGILKPTIPPIDYDSGYESDQSDENKNRAKDNWNKLIGKFKQAVIPEHEAGKLNEAIADSVRIRIEHDNYLQEVSQGKQILVGREFEILHMSTEELENHKLTYNAKQGCLFDSEGKKASTLGKESKNMRDVQAFVMSKEGDIYIGTHKNQYSATSKTLVHGSFLSGRPAETAGVVRINKNGKIDYMDNNSGHYKPEAIDMYRGIKKIQATMPRALDKDCIIHIQDTKPMFVNDFIKVMEAKRKNSNKSRYEALRAARITTIKKYSDSLKSTSKGSVIDQAIKISKDLKKTLKTTPNNSNASNITTKRTTYIDR